MPMVMNPTGSMKRMTTTRAAMAVRRSQGLEAKGWMAGTMKPPSQALILKAVITADRLRTPPTNRARFQEMPVPISAGSSTLAAKSRVRAIMPIASAGTLCSGWVIQARTETPMTRAVHFSARLMRPSLWY